MNARYDFILRLLKYHFGISRRHLDCGDCFSWGTADVTEDILEQSIKDADDPLLFCARVKKMRPMYRGIPKEYWPLFDACGE